MNYYGYTREIVAYLAEITNTNIKDFLPMKYSVIIRMPVISPRSIYLVDSNDDNGYYNIKLMIYLNQYPQSMT